MNKYQEALDELSFPLYDSSCGGCKCGTSDCQDCEKAQAVFTLQELVEKATSKKPVFDKPIMVLECPNCGYYLQTVVDDKGATDGAIPHYCSNCGQKINPYWSEEDD